MKLESGAAAPAFSAADDYNFTDDEKTVFVRALKEAQFLQMIEDAGAKAFKSDFAKYMDDITEAYHVKKADGAAGAAGLSDHVSISVGSTPRGERERDSDSAEDTPRSSLSRPLTREEELVVEEMDALGMLPPTYMMEGAHERDDGAASAGIGPMGDWRDDEGYQYSEPDSEEEERKAEEE